MVQLALETASNFSEATGALKSMRDMLLTNKASKVVSRYIAELCRNKREAEGKKGLHQQAVALSACCHQGKGECSVCSREGQQAAIASSAKMDNKDKDKEVEKGGAKFGKGAQG
jgi:hypothetical protein